MSHKKEERKEEENATRSSASAAAEQQRQKEIVNQSLDETRDSIRRTTDAAIKEVPRYTKAFNDYQEQSIQTARDIATSYIDTQKEILRSFQSALDPLVDNTIDRFRNNYYQYYYMPYPKNIADVYGMMINSLADNTMASVRLANNMIFTNMEAFKTSMQQLGENAKELSKISTDAAKTFERASKDASRG
jgi:hypothetical protein